MTILVLNCGSSSIKYKVLNMKAENDYTLLAQGIVERIGLEMGIVTHKRLIGDREKYKVEQPVPDHTAGIQGVLNLLTDSKWGVLKSLEEIQAVGHRVAQGGHYYKDSVVINKQVKENIQKLAELAPLHNPAHLLGINAIDKLLPKAKQVAVFDTAFHQTMPDYAYMYAVPYEMYEKYNIRRYGFHGTSHKFVARKACKLTGLDFDKSKIITCHLGNGSSITAIKNGKSIDTSMGFTPLEGLVMGTRTGDIDPSIVTFLQEKEGWTAAETNNFLNKKCGLLGLYGPSSDCRDIENAVREGNPRAILAHKTFSYRVLKYIGAYAAAMNGADLIVFTGGIGENDAHVRELIGTRLGYLGVTFDKEKNKTVRGEDTILSTNSSGTKIAVISTDEELVIATDTLNLTN
ncbi:MAG: acetate kinase [Bacteroidales bacterium]|jgi:acetate kinase|nr:acetate kinase [Bacteroidales bacterium]NLK80093.1 acetate kinase [Bacteroidales bacterium]